MRHRQIFDDVAANKYLAKLTDAEAHLFWCMWGSQIITDDFGNFSWDPVEIRLGAIPGRKRWTAQKITQCLAGLVHKGLVRQYEADGKRFGHFNHFLKRTMAGKGYHRQRRCPPAPNEEDANAVGAPSAPSTPSASSVPPAPKSDKCDNQSNSTQLNSKQLKATQSKKNKKESYSIEFETFWETIPSRANNPKKLAFAQWQARLKEGRTPAELICAARNYRLYCERKGKEGEFVLMARTFLGPNERYVEFLEGVPEENQLHHTSEGDRGLEILEHWVAKKDDTG